jgi:hypothetical protein
MIIICKTNLKQLVAGAAAAAPPPPIVPLYAVANRPGNPWLRSKMQQYARLGAWLDPRQPGMILFGARRVGS